MRFHAEKSNKSVEDIRDSAKVIAQLIWILMPLLDQSTGFLMESCILIVCVCNPFAFKET